MTTQQETATAPQSSSPPASGDLRTFWGLIGVMFQGAFSDNVYKLVLTYMVLDQAIAMVGAENMVEAQKVGSAYVSYIGIAFALPWILAVGLAGWLSNRFSKSRITQWTKIMEVAVMCGAVGAYALGNIWLGIGIMFLMSLQSALFSPSKYGILPEALPDKRVAWGNGLLQGFTFISILAATLLAPMIYDALKGQLALAGVLLIVLAVVGLMVSYLMSPVPAANPTEELRVNPLSMVARYGRDILAHEGLRWAVTGMVMFWMVAAMLQLVAVQVIKNSLLIPDNLGGFALAPIVVGNGLGCMLVSALSRRKTELGLVPFGALGMFITCVLVWWLTPMAASEMEAGELSIYQYIVPIAMGLVGLCCGPFVVPVQSFILQACDARVRGGVWATANLFVAFGWLIGPGVLLPLGVKLRGNPGDVFLMGGVVMLVVCGIMCWRFPRIPLRFMILSIYGIFYRARVKGLENMPETGGAMIAPNHQSYLDGIIISALTDRPPRFIMSRQMYNKWFIYPFAKATNSIPIENTQSPRDLIKSLRAATDEIKDGGLVCIFPEGQLTRVGQMQPFRAGFERIMKDTNAPIIPVAIDGAYDTRWALPRGKGQFLRNLWPRRGTFNVTIGEPVSGDTPAWKLRQRVSELYHEAFIERKTEAEPLHRMAIRRLRKRPFARLYADHTSDGMVPNARILAGVVILGNKLKPAWEGQEKVGLLLPPAIGTMILNIAALAAGKVPVNLNYTVSPDVMKTILETAEIKTVITSRLFVEKANLKIPEGYTVVYTEDIRKQVGSVERITGMLKGLFMPVGALERSLGRTSPAQMDDLATLVFSSGSTGIPKGIMLSHWNVWSNSRGALQVFDLEDATILGALPVFHSFGYMVLLWLAMMKGCRVAFYPNPLDAKAIGETVRKYKATHLLGTPTFLATYIRRVEPGQFGSVRVALTGAEKLRESVASAFEQRFGIRPIEGFGCTETSPAVALNSTSWRGAGIYQEATRRGTVGQIVPGTIVRIVDLDTGEDLPPNEPGMLLVKGPNVMQGYYKQPEKTAEVLRDGWYSTGDVAKLDEDGFLTITDRLSRFSKIGGEMVPHMRIEDLLQQCSGLEEQSFAVSSVPDEKRGERLVVFYTTDESVARETLDRLGDPELDVPALWMPRWPDFHYVPELPLLGSGKLDLKALKNLAAEKSGAGAS